jgi:hypothetical protein
MPAAAGWWWMLAASSADSAVIGIGCSFAIASTLWVRRDQYRRTTAR